MLFLSLFSGEWSFEWNILKLLAFNISDKFKNVFGVSVSRAPVTLGLIGGFDKGIIYQNAGGIYSKITRQLCELQG